MSDRCSSRTFVTSSASSRTRSLADCSQGSSGELQRNPTFAEAYAERVVRPRRGPIVDLVTQALERGELRPGTDLIADLLVGPPFFRLILPFGLPAVPADYAERLVDTIWRGLAPPAE